MRQLTGTVLLVALSLMIAGCSSDSASTESDASVTPSSSNASSMSSAPGNAPLAALSAVGVLPFGSDERLRLVGEIVGASSSNDGPGTPLLLRSIDLSMPITVDGVRADLELPLLVNGQSVILDAAGNEIPRTEQDGATDGMTRWTATIQRTDRGKLVLLRMEPVAEPQ